MKHGLTKVRVALQTIVCLCPLIATPLSAVAQTSVTTQVRQGNAPAAPPADPARMIPTTEMPDVHIVLAPQKGFWIVSAVYSKKVFRTEAEGRVRRLVETTNWQIHDLTFEEGQVASMLSNEPSGLSPVMSSSTFMTDAPLVDRNDGAVALEPLLLAYKYLQRVSVTILAPQGVALHGPQQYKDADIDLISRSGQGALTFVTKISNHQATAFHLPRLESAPQAAAVTTSAVGDSGKRLWMIGGLAALALLTGGAAYAVLARRNAY